jgi:ferredoxin
MTDYTVEFVSTGERIDVAETETILRACLREGIAQEYSCRVGMCLACSAEILEGEVTQPAARGLTDAERDRYALTCMARPQSDLVLDRGKYPPSIERDAEAAGDSGDSDSGPGPGPGAGADADANTDAAADD